MARMTYKERAWFEAELHRRIATGTGLAFQDLFSDLMEVAHPGDFDRIRPRGSLGDGKCDGRLVSDGTIFQCYAPRSLDLPTLKKKVNDDFDGALKEWPGMKRWVLVHNDLDGVDKATAQQLDAKRAASGLRIEQWGTQRLISVLHTLDPDTASTLLRIERPGTGEVMLGFEHLQPIVDHLRTRVVGSYSPDLRPPPAAKLDHNGLNEIVRDDIHQGQRRSDLVARYFLEADDEELGDVIAEALTSQYGRMKARLNDPNEIFNRLVSFTGGSEQQGGEHRVAVHAVLAYFFERCDIFERVQEVTDDSADETPGA